MRVNLHTHTRAGSYDGALSPASVVRAYRDAGFGAVAITDHDTVTPPPDVDGITVLRGRERTVDGGSHLHVVELVDYDFEFLAHPMFTFNSLEDALEWAHAHGVDGIERYSRGREQVPADVDTGLVDVANDDAHNHLQVGHSYMEFEDGLDERGIVDALRAEEFALECEHRPASRIVGYGLKALSYASAHVDRAFQGPEYDPGRKHAVYQDNEGRRR